MTEENENTAETKPRATRTPKKEESLNIYQIISKISQEAGALAPEKNGGLNFPFRGIDGTVAHLAPHLRSNGVVVIPSVLEQDVTAREIGNNKVITQVSLTTKFTFYAPDGSSVEAITAGLAQDYSDRAAAQAQSVAFRVALLQVFALPTHSKEPEVAGEEVIKEIDKNNAQIATQKPKAAPKSAVPDDVAKLKEEVAAEFAKRDISKPEEIKAYGDRYFENRAGWATNPVALGKLVAHLKSGEILD